MRGRIFVVKYAGHNKSHRSPTSKHHGSATSCLTEMEEPNITDMADAAIDGFILCFEVPLVKAGIAHLIKEGWSEWNEYSKRTMYRMSIVPTDGNRGGGQRGDWGFSQYSYTYR